ncbi:hypothetical protein OAC87_06405, partial [Pseudomonadales bacterium]|nr:hypothetical protein [Pseudomonadales bacterium]
MLKFTVFQNLFFGLTLINSLVLIALFDETSIDTHLFSISIPTYIAAVLSAIISYVVVPKLATCKDDILKIKTVFSSVFTLFVGTSVVLLGSQFVLFGYMFSENVLYLGNVEIVDKIRLNCTIAALLMICNSIQMAYLYYKELYLTAILINIFAVILQLAIVFLFSSSITIVSFALMVSQCLIFFIFLNYTRDCFAVAFQRYILQDLLSSSSSLLVSSGPAKFDIIQDRTLLSNTGGILYLHYARLACDTIATSITKAFSVVQLTRLSKHSTEKFDNISYLMLIVVT